MNDIINDFLSEDFTLKQFLMYGVCYPLGLMGIILLAGLMFGE
jgi:hypothetical protein